MKTPTSRLRSELEKEMKTFVYRERLASILTGVGALAILITMVIGLFLLNQSREKITKVQNDAVTIRSHVIAGIELYQTGDYKGAVREYDKALALNPNDYYVYNIRGFSLLLDGEVSDAVLSLEKSVSLNPGYSWGYYNLALAYWAAGEKTKTKQAVEKAIECDPGMKHLIKKTAQFKKIRETGLIDELLK
jgi:tetratricopeptide (TPR) repeat protein